ncbi:maltodextrin glucosidase [Raoultella terrigena]|uniref:Maltodextrin glucosidase n=1 Tax=Raoultella terrigena TaxID=577 RepID=A0A3P8L1M9_RAOTE|nr:maltodextrin glucosidase [Raoultella terrigena]
MAKLRKANQALRYGGCQVIYAEETWWYLLVFIKISACWWLSTAAKPVRWWWRIHRLLDVGEWQLKEGGGALHDGVLTLPAVSASVCLAVRDKAGVETIFENGFPPPGWARPSLSVRQAM